MLRFLDAGESHGKGIITIIEGLPLGIPVSTAEIDLELKRRRLGYGRGARMQLESDRVVLMSGVRYGLTLGSPVAVQVMNAEYDKWKKTMSVEGGERERALTMLRPGHADLAGALKYGTRDVRDVLERASARETVGRVCAGALAKRLLGELGVEIGSHVMTVGGIRASGEGNVPPREKVLSVDENPLRCLDEEASKRMQEEIDIMREKGDSLGGIFEVVVYGLPAGLGSHVHWDRRLDARIAAAVMSIQAVKGVEIGDGFKLTEMRGSESADVISHNDQRGFYHLSNHAGGLEGGMSNGEEIVVRAAMKPIPTLANPLDSIDLVSKEKVKAAVERADVCAVPAAAVIAEAMVAFVLADALLKKTGGDNMEEIRSRYEAIVAGQIEF
jgi:chorismate synthase